MKKTYNTPETQVIVIQTQQMMATSMTLNETTKGFGDSLGRESDFDDEEE